MTNHQSLRFTTIPGLPKNFPSEVFPLKFSVNISCIPRLLCGGGKTRAWYTLFLCMHQVPLVTCILLRYTKIRSIVFSCILKGCTAEYSETHMGSFEAKNNIIVLFQTRQLVTQIHESELANSLREVYATGE